MDSGRGAEIRRGMFGRFNPLYPLLIAALVIPAACAAPEQGARGEGAEDARQASTTADGEAAGVAQVRLDRSVLDDPSRPDEEKSQDAARKAIDVYEWLGIAPGMKVADLFCSGGYNTHLLSRIVGPEGKVFGIFEFYANKELFDGQLYKVDVMRERVAKNSLENVELMEKIAELPEEGLDAVLVVRNYHDVEWVFKDLQRKDVVASLYRALKPGGVVGIVEVATDKPDWDEETHRLNERVVIEDFTSGGFTLAGSSDMLANPDDDHSITGFEEGRYKMDRYLLKFEKPS